MPGGIAGRVQGIPLFLYGCQIPKGAWHTVEVIEPSVIFEAKDGAYAR